MHLPAAEPTRGVFSFLVLVQCMLCGCSFGIRNVHKTRVTDAPSGQDWIPDPPCYDSSQLVTAGQAVSLSLVPSCYYDSCSGFRRYTVYITY